MISSLSSLPDAFGPAPGRKSSHGGRRWIFWVGLLVSIVSAGCQREDLVHVKLEARSPTEPNLRQLEIRAQTAGVQTGLHYKWIADLGECDPQESEWPATIFHFAEGSTRDRVAVEVWRGGSRVAFERIDLALPQPANIADHPPPASGIQIETTVIPPYEPGGGPETKATIAGKITGDLPPKYRVVLYARAHETWFIQPSPYASITIQPDGTWSSWTHTGSHYAALVVRPGFTPAVVCDVLPVFDPDVVARCIVEGKK
jgi:hypothetical protein